jgi:hypothetical protein
MSGTKSYWTGPQHGRWIPTDWESLREAVAQGHLAEKRWVEIKERLETGPKAKLELARDLAAMALEGGLLVVGVRDKATTGDDVVGVEDADGVRDRVDQVSRNRISPALHVDTQTIPHLTEPGRGVLLVQVPNTGPHQADHRYWGRSDTGKRPLSDTEVRDHLARQQHARLDIQEEIGRRVPDPGPAGPQSSGVHVLVSPVSAPPECLTEFLTNPTAAGLVCTMAREAAARGAQGERHTVFNETATIRRTAEGIRLTGEANESPRSWTVDIGEDGSLFLSYSSLTEPGTSRAHGTFTVLRTNWVLAVLEDVVAVAGRLGEIGGHQGKWQVGVRVTRLAAVADDRGVRGGLLPPTTYTGSTYERDLEASTNQMATKPWTVTDDLLAPLLRGLSADKTYLPYRPGSDAPGLRAQT